jgi:tetratricopeptide (TPR) repeat protein
MTLDFRIPDRGPALLVALAAIAVHLNSIANGFALDDGYIVQLNGRVHDLTNFSRIWLTPYWPFLGQELGLYRPLTIFLFALQWAVGDGAAWVFHAVNVGLHGLVTVLSYLLLGRLTNRTAAFVGALIFAVHPIHTEAVANVVGQAEIVTAAAVLGACLLHAARPEGLAVSWPRRLLLALLFLIALAAKESAVVLPALLVLTDFAQQRVPLSARGLSDYARAILMPGFLLAAVLAWYLIIRFDVMGSIIGSNAAPAMPYLREEYRLLNALRAFPEFLRLLFFPQDLSADYAPAVIMPVETVRPMVILGGMLILVVTALAALTPWLPAIGFPAAWFAISIVTVSNLFFPIGVLVAERTLYLPSFAVSAIAAFAWQAAAARKPNASRRLAAAAVALVIALGAAKTWSRNPDWRDTNTLWSATYRDNPHSYRSQWVQAALLDAAGRTDQAAVHYQLAYEIYPRDTQFTSVYANFLIGRGRYADAVTMLEAVRESPPFTAFSASVLAHAYLSTGRYEEALEMVEYAEVNGGDRATSMALRAYAYEGLGNGEQALAAWRTTVRYSTGPTWRAWAFLARALAYNDRPREAMAAADSARAAVEDPGVIPIVEAVQRALREGCYESGSLAAPPAGTGFAGLTRPDCDELGEWFSFPDPVQSATHLQNATVPLPGGVE